MSVTSAAANIDWQLIGAAFATLVVAFGATWKGLRVGKDKVEKGTGTITSVVGGTIMENMTMKALTDALTHNSHVMEEHTECIRQQTDCIRLLERAITRQIDMDLLQSRKLDFRDNRDNPG